MIDPPSASECNTRYRARPARSEHLKTEDPVGALGAERILARFQTFLHLQAVELVGVQTCKFHTDGFGLLLRREDDLAPAVPGFQLVDRQLGGLHLIGLQQEDRRGQRRSGARSRSWD